MGTRVRPYFWWCPGLGFEVIPLYQFTQLFIIYRVYRTPHFLYGVGLWKETLTSRCSRCNQPYRNLILLLWQCPKPKWYWTEVIQITNNITGLTLSVDPLTCILGYLDTSLLDEYTFLAASRSLFVMCRMIIVKWVSTSSATISEWIQQMNNCIAFEKQTYFLCNAVFKFDCIYGSAG